MGIIAVLEGEKDEPAKILLQKQFRPPVGRMCIEVPAGLIDAGETPEECAVSPQPLGEAAWGGGDIWIGEAMGGILRAGFLGGVS